MSQVEPKSPSQKDEELQEPETTKLKVDDDIQIENDTPKPTTSPLSSKEDENDNLISDENSNQVEEKNEIVSKENIRSQSRQSLLETKELYKEPAFAEICSFFNLFGALLGIKSIPFTKLEKLFATNESAEVNQELVNLQIMLMRRIRITQHIKPDKWENSLLKFCNYNSTLDDETRQMERYGYDNLSVPAKLLIFKSLCEAQFDNNIKFKENIFNTYYINEMRLMPYGVDKNGQLYWFQQDCELNIRIYAEEPDDMSGGTWSLIARSDLDLSELIESLKQPNFGKNISDEELDEEAILDKPKKKSKKTSQQSVKPKKDENIDYLARLKPEIMDKYYKFLQRRFSSTCCYQDGTNLNKKKQEKEKKKNENHATQNNQENEENNKEECEKVAEKEEVADEIDEFESELRVLPRRSARSNALSNIKTFVSPSKKKEIANEKKTSNAKTPPPLSTSEASDSTDIDEDTENESEQTLDSSDHEFHVKGYSFGRKASRQKKTSKPKVQRQTRPKTGGIKQKKKKSEMIAFEDSSGNSEEEEEVEVKKERPKASGHFACQYCDKATRQDVLLLCDMCDEAWHTHCLKPMLWYVPDGDWFCPRCQHAMLIARFSQLLIDLKENLKNRKIEDQKKKAAAERLKREMEFIGISLNNVIPSKADAKSKKKVEESFSEESDVSDDGMRKSKKRALKKVMTHTRKEEYYGPVVTIAEGRSRRALNKVDYNFSSYDEQIKEAVESGDEPDDPYDTRPQGGLGRGKDMANIIEADRQRRGSEDVGSENNVPAVKARPTTARKPAILRKKKPKLTDLNIDNATDTDSEEYKVNSEESEEPEPSEDEYLPSDLEGRRRSRRRKSDDDFIDNSSESDYVPGGSKKRKGKQNRRQSLRKGRGKRKRHDYDSSEEDDLSDFSAASSEDDRKKRRNAKKRKVESEESDKDESKAYTASGRPLRRASRKAIEKFVDDDEDEELEEKEEIEKKNKRPVGALTRINKKKEDEDEFDPEEEEEEEEDEEEELEDKLEEEDSKSDVSDDDKSDDDKSDDDEQSTSKAKNSFKKPIRSERNVIGMPPHRRPPGAGVARISSSSSDEEKEESTAKDVNEQESDGELPSMVYNNRSSKDVPPESSPKSKVTKNKDRSESPTLEDYIKKSKTMPKSSKEMLPEKSSSSTIEVPTTLATIASIEENSETIAALKPTTAGNSNQDLTEVNTVPEVMSLKKTVIAPAEESALPSWDSLTDDSPMTELKKLADPNRESSFTPSASQQSATYPAPTYATMNAVPPAYPPFPPPHIGPNAMQRMGAPPPGYGIPPNTIAPGYFPPNYYPPNNQWPTPRPNFIPQAPIPDGAHPGNAVNPGAPPTSDPESLGQALAGAMNTEFE